MDIITRDTLKKDVEAKFSAGVKIHVEPHECATVSKTVFGSAKAMQGADAVKIISSSNDLVRTRPVNLSGKFRSGYAVPVTEDGKSVNDLIVSGKFASNSLIDNWENFWEAQRIDLTIKKTMHQTIRQFFYEVLSTPNATPVMELREMFPYAFDFDLNNGEGQAVPLGQKRAGQKDFMTFFMRATGFVYTLKAEMWDLTLNFNKVNDGVAHAQALQKDEDAIKPIFDFNYANAPNGTATTAAAIKTGAGRQELLYLTLENALDDFAQRTDPFNKDETLDASGAYILCHPWDGRHIARILNGLPSVNELKYPAISDFAGIIGMRSETIEFEDHVRTYAGCTKGTIYIVKPNRYMKIAVKRDLTMEVDEKPNALTLARSEKAWYYCESIYNEIGIANFIQKVTLPTW